MYERVALQHHMLVKTFNVFMSDRCITTRVITDKLGISKGSVQTMGEKRNAYRILVGKPESTRPLGRPRPRRVDNIKMDLREIGWDGMDWIDLAQVRD
jgi:hypothetical protein